MRVVTVVLGLGLCASTARADLAALPCASSDVLSEVAALLMLSGNAPTPESLSSAAREAGFSGASLHASMADEDQALRDWLRAMQAREQTRLLCGEAATAERRLVVAAAFGGTLEERHGVLVGELAPGFGAPELVFQGADGSLRRLAMSAEALSRGVALPGGLKLPARVQLVAEGPGGPRPVAELQVGAPRGRRDFTTAPAPTASRAAPASSARPSAPAEHGAAPQEALRTRLAAFRRRHGSPDLRHNALLERSARTHAQAVCSSGRVAHRLADGRDPVARLRAAHIEARAVGEAIGRSDTPQGAMEAIFDSPSHRYAVTERHFTDVGIGHSRDARGRSCVVVLLAAWPRRIP